jgi:hypothetical protein
MQWAGTVLAALLPAHLYLLHYTTNETLSAMLVTATFYCTLRALKDQRAVNLWHWLAGICFGAAMLTKVSALMAAPVFFGALCWRLIERRERNVLIWLAALGIPVLMTVALSGWFYLGMWQRFGTPLAGNWDPNVWPAWWQCPGYRTGGYFFSFGESLVRPLFSGFSSFWDAIYSTLWGDGLCSGSAMLRDRAPWDYNLMVAGYWLALAPTAVVFTGFIRAIAKCIREPRVEWFMMAGVLLTGLFLLVHMGLKIPSYAQIKAFYCLPALLPFCVFGVMGVDFFSQFGKTARFVLWCLLAAWALNVFACFWIVR